MSMYKTFETDEALEVSGTIIDYGTFRVRIASSGQGNKKYAKYAEKVLKPVRRAMEAGSLSNERSLALMADIYATTIILDWQVKVGNEWKTGIEGRNGEIRPFTRELVNEVLQELPALFIDIQQQAGMIANFRKIELEEDGKNL